VKDTPRSRLDLCDVVVVVVVVVVVRTKDEN